jgi:hypothetical protein
MKRFVMIQARNHEELKKKQIKLEKRGYAVYNGLCAYFNPHDTFQITDYVQILVKKGLMEKEKNGTDPRRLPFKIKRA